MNRHFLSVTACVALAAFSASAHAALIQSSIAFNGGEGTHTWSTGPGTITAGTVVRFSTTNLTPAGLTAGINAVVLTNSVDFGQYIGPRDNLGAFALYAQQVNNASNWNIFVGGDQAAVVPNTASFSITAPTVPLPAAGWLLFSGVAALAGFVRRRGGLIDSLCRSLGGVRVR